MDLEIIHLPVFLQFRKCIRIDRTGSIFILQFGVWSLEFGVWSLEFGVFVGLICRI
jgi:hypothetical protein